VGLGILQQAKDLLLDGDLVRIRQFVAVAGKTLMPLSVHGLCDAEMTTPAAYLRERAR
jgi:hypothetical protein